MRRLVAIGSSAAALGAATVGVAASLGVSSKTLTAYSASGTVPTSTCTLSAVADASVDNNSPGSNGGNASTLLVEAGTKPDRTFIRFNVSSCVPANAGIASATLKLYLRTAPLLSRTYDVAAVSASWNESNPGGITWNTQPAVAATPTASTASGTAAGVLLQWSVASDVQRFVNATATNNGWRVADSAESSVATFTGAFDSHEGTNQPSLVVTYWP